MNRHSPEQTDERVLKHKIEQIVADKFGNRSTLVGIQRRRNTHIGSYNCDLITVQLSTGDEFRIFLKDYRVSEKSKDEPEHRRKRELRVYRDILAQTGLGPPEYYGSVWDDSAGRFWLFLEFVDGLVVKHEDVKYGMLAAEWLGRMQGFFTQHPEILASCDLLIRQDGEFFRSKAGQALWNAAQLSPPLARRLSKIIDSYEHAIKLLASQPLSLVHGGYIPWHILLDLKHKPPRICAVDWESAALGPTLYDLAYFTYGMGAQSRARVLDAYRRAAIQHRVPTTDETQMLFIVECLSLHRVFDWLSRGLEKGFSEAKVAWLVEQAEQLSLSVLN